MNRPADAVVILRLIPSSSSLIGVLLALLITGSTLNMFSIIGFIMLMGLVTKNAILLVDFTNQAQREGQSQYQALLASQTSSFAANFDDDPRHDFRHVTDGNWQW